jgi:hypothetical protein
MTFHNVPYVTCGGVHSGLSVRDPSSPILRAAPRKGVRGSGKEFRRSSTLKKGMLSRSDLVAYGVKDHKYYGQAGFGCEPDRSI